MSYKNCQFTWLKQKETLVSLAESLLKDQAFYDCQLCAEGHHINVHRVILSFNSPVLSTILQEHNSDLPVITLDGVSSVELEALVEYMYTGVTRVSPDYLRSFFQTAKSLQLAGLNHNDSSQINKLLDESGTQIEESETQDNYEIYSQNILRYLDNSEVSNDSEAKELSSLNPNDESIFLDESTDPTDIVCENSIVYEKYDANFMKVEGDAVVEPLEQHLVENVDLNQDCETGESNEVEESTSDTPLMYNKFRSIFVKNKEKEFEDNIPTVYSITKLDDLEPTEENELSDLQDELKVMDEEKNFVYIKIENSDTDKKINDTKALKRKRISTKNDQVQFYTEKCLRVINPIEKNYLIKRPKIQSLVAKDDQTNPEDKKIYICLKCGNKYSHRRTLLHHIHWICEQPATYSCSLCPYRGKRKFQLKSHMKHAHMLRMS